MLIHIFKIKMSYRGQWGTDSDISKTELTSPQSPIHAHDEAGVRARERNPEELLGLVTTRRFSGGLHPVDAHEEPFVFYDGFKRFRCHCEIKTSNFAL
jgi:hypothetical protein